MFRFLDSRRRTSVNCWELGFFGKKRGEKYGKLQTNSKIAMSNILEVKNLSVKFGEDKVLDNLSFELKEGENLVIIGPNGAGKTILLKTLLNIIPYQGEITWKKNIKIGYAPQKFLADKNLPLSVEEFFKFKTCLPVSRKSNLEQIKEGLEQVGISDPRILKKKIGVISSGQLQRILIAWNLIEEPDILLFDEPTSGVDIEGEETIYNLLAKIDKNRGLSMILVSHDLNVVYKLADRVLCLNKKGICFGAPEEAVNPENLKKLYAGEIKFYQHDHTHEH